MDTNECPNIEDESHTESATENASGNSLGASKYHIFPELLPTEYEELKASIQKLDPQVPIIEDDEGNLIDGRHRKRACSELGIPCPTMKRHFSSEAEKMEVAAAVNSQRRHLTGQQKRVVISNYLKADTEIADAYLGELLGVSKNTVAAEREKLEAVGQIDELTMLRGKDGKMYPREKRKKKSEPKKKPTGKKELAVGESKNGEAPSQDAPVADTEPEDDDDEDSDDDEIDRATTEFEAALETIRDWVGDDPFETLREVISALGLKMPAVAAWTQQQAEWEAEGDEPIEAEVTPPAPVVAAGHVEGEQPVTASADLAAAPECTEKKPFDEAPILNAPASDKGHADPQPVATTENNSANASAAPLDDEEWESVCDDHGYPDEDGLCLYCGHKTDEPAPMKRRKKPKPKPKLPNNPKLKKSRKKKAVESRPEGEDLTSMVVKALKGVDGGLSLPDLTENVLKLGYKTQSLNLGQAIYNVLGRLKNEGKIIRDNEAKKYILVSTESEVQYVEVTG